MAKEWIAVSDYLPEVGKSVIAFDPNLWCEKATSFLDDASNNAGYWTGACWVVGGGEANVTHWMPFPAKPTEGKDGRQLD